MRAALKQSPGFGSVLRKCNDVAITCILNSREVICEEERFFDNRFCHRLTETHVQHVRTSGKQKL